MTASLKETNSLALDIDKCHPNPCGHGGVCREVVGGPGFACQCISGYKGMQCGGEFSFASNTFAKMR